MLYIFICPSIVLGLHKHNDIEVNDSKPSQGDYTFNVQGQSETPKTKYS